MSTYTLRVITIAFLFLVLLGFVTPPAAEVLADEPRNGQTPEQGYDPAYLAAIQNTAEMVSNEQAQSLATEYGLNIVNLTWEDTGRYYNSAVGPNISDVTIQIQQKDPVTGDYNLTLMPVIRYPNFSDLTADVSPDQFYLLLGNETGQPLERVSLAD
jgi:hypothetical protein